MSSFAHAGFLASAYRLTELPPDTGREVAFAGRSNAGKSSALNALVQRKRLAFVSKTPGRTQTINFFSCGAQRRLVDLPGYGYAAVPVREKRHWDELISAYIESRTSLIGLVLIVDARHPLGALDRLLLDWITPRGKPTHVLLAKSDKLSRRQAGASLDAVQAVLARDYPGCTAQLFSSTTGHGVEAARKRVAHWLK
jgi:GTP-binding protein